MVMQELHMLVIKTTNLDQLFFYYNNDKIKKNRGDRVNTKNVNKLVIVPLVFILVLTLSITYALFAKNVNTNNRSITLSSGNKFIGIYGSNKNNIELNKDYTFTIENRGSIGSGYEIYIESETNIDLSTITYQVTGDITASGNLSNSAILYSALSSDDKKTITLRLTSTSTESYIGKIKVRYKDYIVNYNYTGGVQSFTTPDKGTYRVELWGAQGGSNVQSISGSPASYAAGDIYLNNEILSVKVGAMNGYNGGGSSSNVGFSKNIGATGGGATDVRLSSEPESRIIVAGGGGGAGGSTGEGQYLYHTIICGYAHNSSCVQASTTSGGIGGGSYAGAGGGSSGDVSSLTTAAYGNIPYAKLIGENGKNGSFGQGGAGGASGMYKNGLTNFQNIYSGGTGGGGGRGYGGRDRP